MNPHHDTADLPLGCPMHESDTAGLAMKDVLVLAMPRRMVVQHGQSEAGNPELFLYYDDKEVSFSEPRLFPFGETLARQHRFRAGDAVHWGAGYAWPEVRDLLGNLLEAEILDRDEGPAALTDERSATQGRTSPLLPPAAGVPRTWSDCAAITSELAGHAVNPGHLELIVPVFRVAHISLDADGRQVGEANVFPRPLRLDVPTDWMACPFPGTRYMTERPMNTTALKAMRAHWAQMLAALRVIRARFLERFPDARDGWTVAHVERLATLVLAVPTYQLVRADRRVSSGSLHPALSSLFRVTDGLRMATHQMMFVPVGEPAIAPDAPITAAQIFDYAERNYSFHSETGVCAGPSNMVREFLNTVLGGGPADDFAFESAVAAALEDIPAAFDYGLLGLRAHAAVFTFWPSMARTYERLLDTVSDADPAPGSDLAMAELRLRDLVASMKQSTLLGTEERRSGREAAYCAIFDHCGAGLDGRAGRLSARLEAAMSPIEPNVVETLLRFLAPRFGGAASGLTTQLLAFARRAQAIVAVAGQCQDELNLRIGRPAAPRSFSAADLAVHGRLLGKVPQRLPFITEELETLFGIHLEIDGDGFAFAAAGDFSSSAGRNAS